MNFMQLRGYDYANKKSRRDTATPTVEFGRFTICFTTKGEAFLVDNEIAERIKNYKWSVDNVGYLQARINDERIRLHDLVMAFHYDEKPKECVIDHMNRDKLDNRFTNLRFVNQGMNAFNSGKPRNNTSGVRGVSKNKKGLYEAYIGFKGKYIHLGHYDTLEEAHRARLEAEVRLGYTPNPTTLKEKCETESARRSGENSVTN